MPGSSSRTDALAGVRAALEGTGWAVELYDAEWRAVWFSPQLKVISGVEDDEALGLGRHLADTRYLDAWALQITEESKLAWHEVMTPYVMATTPGGKQAVLDMNPREWQPMLRGLEPIEPPPVWTWQFSLAGHGTNFPDVSAIGVSLWSGSERTGYALIYGPAMPASLLTLILSGDRDMFDRMARLAEPRRAQAAVLFADLQASGTVSRRLPSSAYFTFVRRLSEHVDREVLARQGIVGRHAGDGMVAFFLADDAGGASAAAAAALETARAIPAAARAAADATGGLVRADEAAVNVGVHWGGSLYMGQILTGGRLEVTALGDEVTECARMQECARDGALLASRALVEQLDPDAARALGVAPEQTRYEPLGLLAEATEKARRDAATLSVTDVRRSAEEPG